MKKNSVLYISLALVLSGCSSSEQMSGVFTGGMLGGIFGSSIGGLMDGPRGHDAGNLIGMVVGGTLGAAVTAPKTKKVSKYDERNASSRHRTKGYQNMPDASAQRLQNDYDNLNVENLRFIDRNNNHIIDAGEHGKIQFEVKNNGPKTLYNITPVIGVTDNKRILISPTAIIASLAPGKGVKYTAEVYGKPNLKTGIANFTLGFVKGEYIYTSDTFQLETQAR